MKITFEPKTNRLYVGVFLSFQHQNQVWLCINQWGTVSLCFCFVCTDIFFIAVLYLWSCGWWFRCLYITSIKHLFTSSKFHLLSLIFFHTTHAQYAFLFQGSLIDFALTSSDLWAHWITNDGESVTYVTKFEKYVNC